MKTTDLNGEYRLYSFSSDAAPALPSQLGDDWISATVPGNVELDYQRAGLLPDVFFAENYKAAEALEQKDFWYVRSFRVDELQKGNDAFLCFDGVDTVADYFLNGTKIGESRNMFIGHEFTVTDVLRVGENTLAVHIHSAVDYAKQFDTRPYNVAFPGCYENLSVRKAAINYGWDISPRLLTAGIFRDVRLELRDAVRFRDVYLTTASVYDGVAVLVLNVNTQMPREYFGKCELQIDGVCGEHRFSAKYPLPHQSTTVYPYVKNAALWYPNGAGEQNLYDISVKVLCGESVLAENCFRYGIRTVKLDFGEATGENGKFCLYVNNRKIRCRGANSVPVSMLYSQSEAGYDEVVRNFKDSNCNIVRVWGGGIYEGETFFNLCDELGILVWQDMMLSCHAYPMDDGFYQQICEEAEAIAKRIRNHPSLAFYCGGNETDWPYVCVGLNPNDDRISRKALKETLWQFDPYRDYYPSTPFFSNEFIRDHGGRFYLDLDEIKAERTSLPEEHYWWHREDFQSVREQNHIFIGEIGYSGAAPRKSTDKYLPAGWSYDSDKVWASHSWPTEGRRDIGYKYLFADLPDTDEAKLLSSQYYQAEAYKFIIELCRMRKDNNGIVIWTMRENWPSFSSAIVDYYGERKPAFDAVRLSYEPLQCMIDVVDGKAICCLVNDTGAAQTVKLRITDENGNAVYSDTFSVAADELVRELAVLPAKNAALLLTELQAGDRTVFNYRYLYTDKISYHDYCALRARNLPAFKSFEEK